MSNFLLRKLEYQELVKKPRDWLSKIAQASLNHISLPCSTTYREAVRITPTAKTRETPSSLAKQTLVQWLTHWKLRVWQPWSLKICYRIKARKWSIFPKASQFPCRKCTSSNDRANLATWLSFSLETFLQKNISGSQVSQLQKDGGIFQGKMHLMVH